MEVAMTPIFITAFLALHEKSIDLRDFSLATDRVVCEDGNSVKTLSLEKTFTQTRE